MSNYGELGPVELPPHLPPADASVSDYQWAMQNLAWFTRQHVDTLPATVEQLDGAMIGVRESLYTFLLARGRLEIDRFERSNELRYKHTVTLNEEDLIRRPSTPTARLYMRHALYYGVTDLSIVTGPRLEDPRYGLRLHTGLRDPARGRAARGLTPGETAAIVKNDGVMQRFDPSESRIGRKGFYVVSQCVLRYLMTAAAASPPLSLENMLHRLKLHSDG